MKWEYKMNIEILQKIEKFLFKYKEKGAGAAFAIADVVGVLIGLKPSAVICFSNTEMEKADCVELKELLEAMNLKAVFYHNQMVTVHELVWSEYVFISRELETAVSLHDNFAALWASMDDWGLVVDKKSWAKATKRIGKLLGYPKTSVESFVRNETEKKDIKDSLTIVGGKYRYFAHSKKYAEEEAEMYDKPLNEALKKYSPAAYEVLYK